MTDKELQIVRQNIACPQFGDDHYGSWGALNLNQRRAIKRMLHHVHILEEEIERLNKEHTDMLHEIKRLNAQSDSLRLECGNAKFAKYKADFEEFRAEIKADAHKTFTDKLKDQFDRYGVDYTAYAIVDDVANEMVGDRE